MNRKESFCVETIEGTPLGEEDDGSTGKNGTS